MRLDSCYKPPGVFWISPTKSAPFFRLSVSALFYCANEGKKRQNCHRSTATDSLSRDNWTEASVDIHIKDKMPDRSENVTVKRCSAGCNCSLLSRSNGIKFLCFVLFPFFLLPWMCCDSLFFFLVFPPLFTWYNFQRNLFQRMWEQSYINLNLWWPSNINQYFIWMFTFQSPPNYLGLKFLLHATRDSLLFFSPLFSFLNGPDLPDVFTVCFNVLCQS